MFEYILIENHFKIKEKLFFNIIKDKNIINHFFIAFSKNDNLINNRICYTIDVNYILKKIAAFVSDKNVNQFEFLYFNHLNINIMRLSNNYKQLQLLYNIYFQNQKIVIFVNNI